MKWLGAIILISTTTWFGFDLSKKLKERTTQIRTVIQSLQILEAEMSYSYSSLKQIFQKISRKIDSPVDSFYRNLAERLNEVVSDFVMIWDEELERFTKRSALKTSDVEILTQFGRNLGQHTLRQQQKHIQLTLHYLQRQLDEAEELKKRYETMMKSLGILIGLFIVIILF